MITLIPPGSSGMISSYSRVLRTRHGHLGKGIILSATDAHLQIEVLGPSFAVRW